MKLDTFREQYNTLVDELNLDQTPWKERDDVTVMKNMQDLKNWKRMYEKIGANFKEYERIVTVHGEQDPSAGDLSAAKDEFEAMKETFDKAREELEAVDLERELFSTKPPSGEKLDYPKFSGASSEDFVKFKDKMTKAFRRNQVGKSDQVEKLRKVLSGFALSLVPESTETIDKAFETLSNAFGDPKKVLDDRMKKLGNEKPGFRKQEEWYLHIEGLLGEIIELGNRNEDLGYHVYSEETFNFIVSLFPTDIASKLAEIISSRKEKLGKVKENLVSYRQRSQRLGKIYGDKPPPGASERVGGKADPVGRKTGSSSQSAQPQTAQPGTIFRGPEQYTDCKVCKHLEQQDKKTGLYEKHLSTYPTGCPQFISMNIS